MGCSICPTPSCCCTPSSAATSTDPTDRSTTATATWRRPFGGPIGGKGLAGRLDPAGGAHGLAVDGVDPAQLLNAMSLVAGIPASDIDEESPAVNAAKILGTTCELPEQAP